MGLLTPAADALDVAAALAHLATHGWAPLGRVLDDEGLAGLRERADEIMLGRVVIDGLFFQADTGTGRYEDLAFGQGFTGPSLAYRKIEKLERDDRFRAWIENPLHERIARAWIGAEISIYRAVLMTKGATGGTPLPWHQDGGYFWGIDRPPTLQIWTALDDAPREAGCVEVVPGSHADGLTRPSGGTIPQAIHEAAGAEARALPLPAVAGEAYLLHNHVWHRSGVNTTGRTRRGFSICYMDAATRCLRKKHAPRTFFRPWAGSPSPSAAD